MICLTVNSDGGCVASLDRVDTWERGHQAGAVPPSPISNTTFTLCIIPMQPHLLALTLSLFFPLLPLPLLCLGMSDGSVVGL
jgi:hypothetical protein